MSLNPEPALSPHQVAAYLRAHPHFLQEHPEVLSDLVLSLGASGTVSSLLERQVLMLRERLKAVDQRQSLMLRHAQENEAIQNKLMQLVRGLLQTPADLGRAQRLVALLRNHFGLTRVELIQPDPDDEQTRLLQELISVHRPSCWSSQSDQGRMILASLAPPSEGLGSLALLPIQADPAGSGPRALVLAASDPGRFEAGQGVVFLERIAEIASAALYAPSS